MQAGRIEQVGAPLDLFDRPANVFVAGFIGSPAMNLLKGKVADGGTRVAVGGVRMPVPAGAKLTEGSDVIYGVRPEHFDLSPDGFEATIKVIEPTGSETLVFLRMGDADLVALFRDRHSFTPGETLRLSPRPELVHLFDPQSGRRI
jgi:multiple sugar transport system ATP-binding protein